MINRGEGFSSLESWGNYIVILACLLQNCVRLVRDLYITVYCAFTEIVVCRFDIVGRRAGSFKLVYGAEN